MASCFFVHSSSLLILHYVLLSFDLCIFYPWFFPLFFLQLQFWSHSLDVMSPFKLVVVVVINLYFYYYSLYRHTKLGWQTHQTTAGGGLCSDSSIDHRLRPSCILYWRHKGRAGGWFYVSELVHFRTNVISMLSWEIKLLRKKKLCTRCQVTFGGK